MTTPHAERRRSNPPVEIRSLDSVAELQLAVELQRDVWQPADRDLVPVTELVAASHNDGIALGAFSEGRMVGFLFSMIGRRQDRYYQYSRMLAVHPGARGRGLGAALKLEQKRIALQRGYTWMEWTFDPLEARNASLNLRRLGARVRVYHRDYYGNRTTRFDQGVPTDRFLAEWDLKEDLEKSGEARRAAHRRGVTAFRVQLNAADLPVPGTVRLDLTAPVLLIPVPMPFQPIRERFTDLALQWRMALRESAEDAFEAGYHVVDLTPNLPNLPGCGAHVLVPEGAL